VDARAVLCPATPKCVTVREGSNQPHTSKENIKYQQSIAHVVKMRRISYPVITTALGLFGFSSRLLCGNCPTAI
jgi:hypothetical protein